MDELDEITIDYKELPQDLTLAELDDYIRDMYPNTYVNVEIFVSPIIKFGELPSELLSKIIMSKERYQSTSINKPIRKHSILDIYNNECNEPISNAEIANYIIYEGRRGSEPIILTMDNNEDNDYFGMNYNGYISGDDNEEKIGKIKDEDYLSTLH